jgi:serine/threonine-protein kinase RsbW
MAGESADATREYRLSSLAVPDSLDLLHELLARVGEDHPGIAPADLMLFETAVVEIAGNVVEHGRPKGKVAWQFQMSVHDDRLESLLTDSGEEYSGELTGVMPDVASESGRGLALAQAALDELSYGRVDGRNRWRLVRRRSATDRGNVT